MDNIEFLNSSLLNQKIVEVAAEKVKATGETVGPSYIRTLLDLHDYKALEKELKEEVLANIDMIALFKLIKERMEVVKAGDMIPKQFLDANVESFPVTSYEQLDPYLLATLHYFNDLAECTKALIEKLLDIKSDADGELKLKALMIAFGFESKQQELQIPRMPSRLTGPSREKYFANGRQ